VVSASSSLGESFVRDLKNVSFRAREVPCGCREDRLVGSDVETATGAVRRTVSGGRRRRNENVLAGGGTTRARTADRRISLGLRQP